MKTGLAKPAEVADYLGTTPGALAQMRYTGTGPKFIKLTGRAVRYRWEAVEEWLASQERTRTGQEVA